MSLKEEKFFQEESQETVQNIRELLLQKSREQDTWLLCHTYRINLLYRSRHKVLWRLIFLLQFKRIYKEKQVQHFQEGKKFRVMKYNILITEDEREIAELIKLYLENENYRVFCAEDGKEALEFLEQESIDMAILDITLTWLLRMIYPISIK